MDTRNSAALADSASVNTMTSNTSKKNSGRKVILASGFGTALEFYDFAIFNFFVITIASRFFAPDVDPKASLLYSLMIFGASFFLRPLGGIIIGMYADRYGRKPAMVLTITLMSVGTAMIGLVPAYAQIGYWSTAILVLARLLQGFAAGGEVGAATSMLVESAPLNRRGFFSSWQIATQGAAVTFGGLVSLTLALILPLITGNDSVMSEWGWRLPFLLGVLLAPIGCWLRLSLENDYSHAPSTAATSSKAAAEPVHESTLSLLRANLGNVLIGVVLTIGGTVATYISMYYLGTYAVAFLGLKQIHSHAAMMLAGLITFIGSPLAGMLCDKIGRKKPILWSRISILLMAYPSFWLLSTYPSAPMLLIIVFIMVSLTTLGAAPSVLVLPELFPKRIRALAFSLVYSIAVAIFGGFAQAIVTKTITLFDGALTAPAWYLGICTLISMSALLFFKDGLHQKLKE